MNIIKRENLEKELEFLENLKNEYGTSKELIIELIKNGYNLCELGTSMKCFNQDGDVLNLQIKGKKYLNGHYIGIGGGYKLVGKVNMSVNHGIWMGFVKKVE